MGRSTLQNLSFNQIFHEITVDLFPSFHLDFFAIHNASEQINCDYFYVFFYIFYLKKDEIKEC